MSDTPNAKDGAAAVPPDPIYQKSYSVHIAVASVALIAAVALAIADEVWLRRPYKAIQADYKEATLAYLERLEAERISYEQALERLDRYRELRDALRAAVLSTDGARLEAQRKFDEIESRADGLSAALREARSELAALTYEAEHVTHEAGEPEALTSEAAAGRRARMDAINATHIEFEWKRKVRRQVPKEKDGEPVVDAQGRPEMEDVVDEEVVKGSGLVGELNAEFLRLQNEKGDAQRAVGDSVAPVNAARKALTEWTDENLLSISLFLETPRAEWSEDSPLPAPPTADQLRQRVAARIAEVGLNEYLDEYAAPVSAAVVANVRKQIEQMPTGPLFGGEIQKHQIHLANTNHWVDRCEVCHLGARSPVPVAEEDLEAAVAGLNWPEERIRAANLSLFASHPRAKELFAKHDPEKVGCSICHNGNGIAITSVELAHGLNHHWLLPLHPKENVEAGCLQCHQDALVLDGGPRISAGREAFRRNGCWGCHPYEGHDREGAAITAVRGELQQLERDREDLERRRSQLTALAAAYQPSDDDESMATSARLYAEQKASDDVLVQRLSQLDTEIRAKQHRLASLHGQRQKPGPSLKEIRVAMRPEIVTPWIQDPTHVRPDTRMPVFRWWGGKDADGLDAEAKDVAAFIWQSGLDPEKFREIVDAARLPPGGSAGRGKQLFEQGGCLGCHSVEVDGKRAGNDFAANLTNVGDKKTGGWIYRWIRNPRHRLVPYSTALNRDLTREEAIDAEPDTLVWRNPTSMPDLRLNDEDARDVATYLAGLRSDRKWPDAPWLLDAERAERGKALVLNRGCAGCHEIAGLESERGIGTDLTREGSKPIDRLDFGHLTTEAKRGHEPIPDWESADGVKVFAPAEGEEHGHGWYRPRGFFMHKLAQPDVFDAAKLYADPSIRSRMPKFRLTAQNLHDLTTFLLGSVETAVPVTSRHDPDDAGQALRDGWWVLRRYNCEGCHPVRPGDVPAFQKLPWWTPETVPDMTFPPTLVGEGFRVRPEWLAHFLHDPSLGGGTAEPRGLRRHLAVRMPTYDFTEEEVAKLVRFFGAASNQPSVYQPPRLEPLAAAEKAAGDLIWSKDGMNCLQCHLVGDQKPNSETKAPVLDHAPERLRPEWMYRWIPWPAAMQPWTKMTKNFVREGGDDQDPHSRWIYMDTPTKPVLQDAKSDHAMLMVRYLYFRNWPK